MKLVKSETNKSRRSPLRQPKKPPLLVGTKAFFGTKTANGVRFSSNENATRHALVHICFLGFGIGSCGVLLGALSMHLLRYSFVRSEPNIFDFYFCLSCISEHAPEGRIIPALSGFMMPDKITAHRKSQPQALAVQKVVAFRRMR